MKKNRPTWWALLVLGLAGAAGLAATSGTYVEAADHLDPPARTNPMATPPGTDRTADIADVFAWSDPDTDRMTVIMSFGGPNPIAADQAVVCDEDVLYEIHIDTDADADFMDDDTISVRLGDDDLGNCFYRIEGVPGTATGEVIVGPVGFQTDFEEVNTMVALFDDAFFFDLEGFRAVTTMGTLFNDATPATGDLLFVNDRDFFADKNTPAIVIEFPTLAVSSGDVVRVWGSTRRITP
jgi:hypothetical protein